MLAVFWRIFVISGVISSAALTRLEYLLRPSL
jgi:hypothetical protein